MSTAVEKKPNWYEFKVDPADFPGVKNPHITLLYGFDPIHYDEIDAYAKSQNFTHNDWKLGKKVLRCYKLGSEYLSPHIVQEIISPKLQHMFSYLSEVYPNQHGLINGEYSPHVTLQWLNEEYGRMVLEEGCVLEYINKKE